MRSFLCVSHLRGKRRAPSPGLPSRPGCDPGAEPGAAGAAALRAGGRPRGGAQRCHGGAERRCEEVPLALPLDLDLAGQNTPEHVLKLVCVRVFIGLGSIKTCKEWPAATTHSKGMVKTRCFYCSIKAYDKKPQ